MKGDIDLPRSLGVCAAVGLAAGLVSAVPILRWPNVCCLWIVAGGFVSAYLCTRGSMAIEFVDGAVLGGIFGLFYGIVVSLSTVAINVVLNFLGLGNAVRGVTGSGIADKLGLHLGVGLLAGLFLVVLNFILGIVFGAVGGIIYAAAFEEGVSKPASAFGPSRGGAQQGRSRLRSM